MMPPEFKRYVLLKAFLFSTAALAATDTKTDAPFEELPDPSQEALKSATPKESEDILKPTKDASKAKAAKKILTPKKADIPKEIRDLEEKFELLEETEKLAPGESRKNRVGVTRIPEPGDELEPEEKFSRVPLHPPMSNANWVRWSGPRLDKTHRIRNKDTLWGLSDILFGNPHIWPKVWHLNAKLDNPHVIHPGYFLQFHPGSPNAAPQLSISGAFTKEERIPLQTADKNMTHLERIEAKLRSQVNSPDPPFKFFLLDKLPSIETRITVPEALERVLLYEGDQVPMRIRDGEYNVIRTDIIKNNRLSAYRVRWLGILKAENGMATVTKAYAEISEGDLVIDRTFKLNPISVHEASINQSQWRNTHFLPLHEGYSEVYGEEMAVGIKFAGAGVGPDPGALLNVQDRIGRTIGTLLLLDRDGTVGTGWVIESSREIKSDDLIR